MRIVGGQGIVGVRAPTIPVFWVFFNPHAASCLFFFRVSSLVGLPGPRLIFSSPSTSASISRLRHRRLPFNFTGCTGAIPLQSHPRQVCSGTPVTSATSLMVIIFCISAPLVDINCIAVTPVKSSCLILHDAGKKR